MKPARLAVLAIALTAGGAAAMMMGGEEAPPAPVAEAPPAIPTTDVLVAASDLAMGHALKDSDLRWQPWPDTALSPTYTTRKAAPNALTEAVGAIVRTPLATAEPVRAERLAKAGTGFMAAILPAGMRAVAVEIARGGGSSAGGFILPNDRVDVIRVSGSGADQASATLLTDVRVLAVGQVVQEKNGETVVTGETATLALTPAQAEDVTLAQKVGTVSLVLRSILDASASTAVEPEERRDAGFTVVRFGVPALQPRR